ncbi:hypothetical protein [Streptomyces aureus]|uniref:hypothetical protein n=1 Tax=Streptomyces aureus TaxID=193461 RepID=UPI00340AEB54
MLDATTACCSLSALTSEVVEEPAPILVLRRGDVIKRVRKITGVALAVIVTLTACSGNKPSDAKSSPKPTSSSGSEAGTPKPRKASGKADAALTDSWLAARASMRPDAERSVILRIDGPRVELLGAHPCRGKVSKEDGLNVIRLTCADGNTDRTVGRVYGLSAKTMTVDWEGFGADMFLRATHAKGSA